MAKNKRVTYEEKIIKSLEELPNPIMDKKHGLEIFFINNRARSNESRFEHISVDRHELKPRDIKRIVVAIKTSILRKDKQRKNTYNLYIKRTNYNDEYIKISLYANFQKNNEAIVKTIFITKNFK